MSLSYLEEGLKYNIALIVLMRKNIPEYILLLIKNISDIGINVDGNKVGP